MASFFFGAVRPLRISWLVVGMRSREGSRGGSDAAPYASGTPASASSTSTYGTPTASATGA